MTTPVSAATSSSYQLFGRTGGSFLFFGSFYMQLTDRPQRCADRRRLVVQVAGKRQRPFPRLDGLVRDRVVSESVLRSATYLWNMGFPELTGARLVFENSSHLSFLHALLKKVT